MNDEEILRGIERYIADQKHVKRRHASFFYAGRKYKGIGEASIAQEFVPSLERILGISVDRVVNGDDPPDIVFEVNDIRKFAIELTELVNPKAITAQINKDDALYAAECLNWDSTNTCERIESLLGKKQSVAEKIAISYERYTVLIHTDETMLTSYQVSRFVSGHKWPEYSNIDDAYVICSYEPGNGYPVIKLFGS